MLVEFVLSFLTLMGLWILYENRRPKNYPPGPVSLPIFGNLLDFLLHSNQIAKYFAEVYEEKYGKVFSIKLASYRAVIINDYKLIREAWNIPEFCGRPKLHGAKERTGGVIRGIIFQDGSEWSEQRRFALRHLRDFGFGKKSMENLVNDEVQELIKGFLKDAGKPISTQNKFNVAVLNALWTITAGERFSHDDSKLQEIMQAIAKTIESTKKNRIIFFMPWLIKIIPRLIGWKEYQKNSSYTFNFLKGYCQKILKKHNGREPEHFTDVFIEEIKKTTDQNSSFYGKRGEETMVATLQDLFVAGAETTSTTLTWTFLYLATFPEIQRKLHEEIDRIIGSRLPSLTDKPRMPYLEAVIMESMRFSSMTPTGILHRTSENCQIGGFTIPKDTLVIANLYAAHFDKKYWKDPETFNPERFLNGETIIRHEAFLPFSYGKRACLGETLAKDELFLFMSGIFQRFSVCVDPNHPNPSLVPNNGLIAVPKPHKLILLNREK